MTKQLTPDDGIEYYRNALEWIRFRAGIHWLGGAFEPKHMADLCDYAADVLNGEELVDDYVAKMEEGKARAEEWTKLFHFDGDVHANET